MSLQVQLRETIRDVKTLHNENLVAVAQKKYVYIYDNQGAEVCVCIKPGLMKIDEYVDGDI